MALTRTTYQGPPVSLIFGALLVFGSSFGALSLQRHAFPPTDKLVAGPVHGLMLCLIPAAIASIYLLFAGGLLFSAAQRRGLRLRSLELFRLLFTGRRGWLTAAVFICCGMAISYGLSAFWYATPDGLTVRPGWPAPAVTYAWSDVTKRLVSCYRARGGPNVVFQVQMRDGQTIDLADTQQSDFALHFREISMLTRNAVNVVGDVKNCPEFIRGLVRSQFGTS